MKVGERKGDGRGEKKDREGKGRKEEVGRRGKFIQLDLRLFLSS